MLPLRRGSCDSLCHRKAYLIKMKTAEELIGIPLSGEYEEIIFDFLLTWRETKSTRLIAKYQLITINPNLIF